MKYKIILIFFLLICFNIYSISLQEINTEQSQVIYYSAFHDYIIPHIVSKNLKIWLHDQEFWGYNPSEKPVYFINDFSDFGNGGAIGLPFNFVMLSLAPPINAYDILPQSERVQMLQTHELMHIIAMDQSSPQVRRFRKFFAGKTSVSSSHPETVLSTYLTVPRYFAPRWYHEGIAVFMETWQNSGVGRTLSAYDEMIFRSIIKDQRKIFTPYNLESEGTGIDFTMGSLSYIYGTRFVSYLAIRYTPEKVVEWYNINQSKSFDFSHAFKQTFACDLEFAWEQWIQFEQKWQEENLERLNKSPFTEYKIINSELNGSFSRMFYDNDTQMIYTAYKPYNGKPQLISIDKEGRYRKLVSISNAANNIVSSLVFDQTNKRLFYTTDNWQFRDLWVYDLLKQKNTLLIKDLRAGHFAFRAQDGSLWGIRHNNGLCTLIKLEAPYTDWKAIHVFNYGHDIFDLDISPNGEQLVAIISDIQGNHKLALFDFDNINRKGFSYSEPIDFEDSAPNHFVFSPDSKQLFGSSYYTGVSNIFQHNIQENESRIVSHTDVGFFRPCYIGGDSLIALKFTSQYGFTPITFTLSDSVQAKAIHFMGNEIVEKYPQVKGWFIPETDSSSFLNYKSFTHEYSVLKNTQLLYWHPIVLGYKDYVSYGARFTFGDKTNLLSTDTHLSYSPSEKLESEEMFHFYASMRYMSWTLKLKHNYANFYDLFGPEKQSRKGDRIELTKSINLFNDETIEALSILGMYATFNNDALSLYQDVAIQEREIYSFDHSFTLSNTRKTLGAIDSEYGYVFNLYNNADKIKDDYFIKSTIKADVGFITPVKNMNIWLRNYSGKIWGDQNSSNSYYYFGGFRNNYLDYRSPSRYQELPSFPGVDINEIPANQFVKSMLELNFPPFYGIQFKSLQMMPKYLKTSLFTSILLTDVEAIESKNIYSNIGIQWTLKMQYLSQLSGSLSLGYARAFHESHSSDELMLSVSLFN